MNYFVYPGIQYTAEGVLATVEKLTGITKEQIQTRTRQRSVVSARHLTAHLLSTILSLDVASIAKILYPYKGDNRSSVEHLLKMHNSISTSNIIYRNIVKQAHHQYGNIFNTDTATEP